MNRRESLKLSDKRTGYVGEDCFRPRGRRFIKRLEHRHNRRHAKKELEHGEV